MRAGLGSADPDFAVRQHPLDPKQRDVRNAKASVDRQRNEIGDIVAIPFVLAGRSVALAGLVHLFDFIVCERLLLLVCPARHLPALRVVDARAGLLCTHLLQTQYSKNGFNIAIRRTAVCGLTDQVERNWRMSMGSHWSIMT